MYYTACIKNNDVPVVDTVSNFHINFHMSGAATYGGRKTDYKLYFFY